MVVPMLSYEDAASAIDWLCDAFGFEERTEQRRAGEDGTVGHAELRLGDGVVFLATPSEHYRGPKRHAEECAQAARWLDNPWVVDGVYVDVDDLDAHFARAAERGATILREPTEAEPGLRVYSAADPEGHRWMFGERA